MSKGWIALHRDIQDHWISDNDAYFSAWVVMLFTVNHGAKKILIKGKLLECKRGEALLSHASWAKKLGGKWNRQKVIRFFKLLENDKMIEQVNEQVTTRVIVNNYGQYQDVGNKKRTPKQTRDDTPSEHQANTKRTGDDTQLNNVNNENNENNMGGEPQKIKRFVKPSIEIIAEYCAERENSINAKTFYNHYESKGWMIGKSKVKCWKSCVHTWEQRAKKNVTQFLSDDERKKKVIRDALAMSGRVVSEQ